MRAIQSRLLAPSHSVEHRHADHARERRGAEHRDLGRREIAGFRNASPAMKSDIVKPMPESAPAPASCRHEYAAGFTAMRSRTASAEATTMPSGLPSTSPAPIASSSGS